VRSGDTLVVGPQSSAQVRFTDDSLVALRADTTFRVSEYAYAGQESGTQRALFDLLQGGLRTVTGVIGRRDQTDYAVKTRTTTIGVRGTSYSLVDCDNSCRNADGSLAPDGTYGAVTEGRISAANNTGEREFGVDNFFYVASPNAPPEQLLAPPSFLAAIRGRATGTQLAQAARSGAATASASATQGGGNASAADPTASGLPMLTPVAFQVTSTAHPESLLSQNSFTGTSFYRLTGPFNIPFSCAGCGSATAGEITLGVNYALQRATLGYALSLTDGTLLNVSVPISISGLPITINGNQVSFTGTFNLADFPNNRGSFRCYGCATDNTPGFISQLTFSGTVSGTQATVTFTGIAVPGDPGGTAIATLTQQAPPNNSVAAIVTQRQGGGADARSAAFWNVQLDASGRLLQFGPNVGEIVASVGTATNTIAGTAPGAGNLVWGTWTGGGSRITDFNYNTFTTATGQRQPWISGDATNSLPASLGTLTFAPVGSVFDSTVERLNNASLTADFVNRSLSVSINATNTSAQNTFQMNGVTGFSPTTGRFSSGFNSVTCTGPCVGGVPGGTFAGFFAGSQAQGAGVAFTAGFGLGTGVSGVVAFGR
jgi:FecR protein